MDIFTSHTLSLFITISFNYPIVILIGGHSTISFISSALVVMGYELSVDPPTNPISAIGGTHNHKLVNHTDRMLAFKINSSPNSHYTVTPMQGLIQIGYTFDIVITRSKGKSKADKLSVLFADVPQSCIDPSIPFKGDKIVGEIVGEQVIKLAGAE